MRKTARALVVAAVLIGVSAASAQGPAEVWIGKAKTDAARTVAGNNAFALDLYARLRGEEGNLFLSPFSLSTALAMTYAGADGETGTQIYGALRFPRDGMTAPFELGNGLIPCEDPSSIICKIELCYCFSSVRLCL